MTPTSDLATIVARLEKENRNLITRVGKLEKQRGSSLLALLANVILLVSAGLLAVYLVPMMPRGIDRLPLHAKKVEAEEFVLRKGGMVHARVIVDGTTVRVVDVNGKLETPKTKAE